MGGKEGEGAWVGRRERMGGKERVCGREEERGGIPRRSVVVEGHHITHTCRYGGQRAMHAVMKHCV